MARARIWRIGAAKFGESSVARVDDILRWSGRADLGSPNTSGWHGGHQTANAQNLYRPLHVVGQHVQRHFASHFRQPSHLEVRGAHPRLDGPERMLHGLTTHAHLFRVAVEPVLHRLENVLVLPARYPAFLARCAPDKP